MNADRFRRIDEIFNHARSLEHSERAAYLESACGDDRSLRDEVAALLNHDSDPRGFLKTPAIKAGLQFSSVGHTPAHAVADSEGPMPDIIGGYRIERIIGEGGFGIVYLAIQENPRRTVALKVIRAAIATPTMLKRFEYEAQVLGRLTHPGIAQVYEAGADRGPRGVQAFFAMEYIRGKRLDHYANENRLDVNTRLELIAKVCDAVQYAHQKGVIHRDLKPQNILVGEHGLPKILDFGVSRAADTDIYTTTLQTSAGQLIGTLPYMSPEQVSGDPAEVDTRSDVYALGVILYQLLTGQLPHDLSSRSIPEAARVIRDEQPTRLSSFSRNFRGDVDTIVLKAMEKDKTQRYQTAADLAADLRRFLAGEPIEAKRSSGWYVLQKTLRRYKLLATLSGAFIVVLIAASIALGILYNRSELQAAIARRERNAAREAQTLAEQETQRARREELRATTIKNFVLRMLQSADTRSSRGRERTVREVLDAVARWLDTSLKTEPRIEATIRDTVAQTYASLGLLEQAETQNAKSMAIREKLSDEPDVEYADCLMTRAVLMSERGDYAGAEKTIERVLEIHQDQLPPGDSRIASDLMNLGSIRIELGKLDGVEEMLTRAVDLARKAPPIDGPQEEEDSELASTLSSLGKITYAKRDYKTAEAYFREAMDVVLRKLGDDHALLAPLYNNLAAMLDNQARTDEALTWYVKSLDLAKRTLGEKHPDVANALCGVGQAHLRLKQAAAAEPFFREALEIRRAALQPGHPAFGQVLTGLGRSLLEQGKAADALDMLREAMEIRRATSPPGDYGIGYGGSVYGACLLESGDLDQAESVLLDSYEILIKTRGEKFLTTQAVADSLARLYEKRGDTARSAQWQAKARSGE